MLDTLAMAWYYVDVRQTGESPRRRKPQKEKEMNEESNTNPEATPSLFVYAPQIGVARGKPGQFHQEGPWMDIDRYSIRVRTEYDEEKDALKVVGFKRTGFDTLEKIISKSTQQEIVGAFQALADMNAGMCWLYRGFIAPVANVKYFADQARNMAEETNYIEVSREEWEKKLA